MTDTFLSTAEVADLTDIRTGKNGRTREQLQIDALRKMKVPFVVSAIGRPKVARAIIEGGKKQVEEVSPGWEPAAA